MTRVDMLVEAQEARRLVHPWTGLERDTEGRIRRVDHAPLVDQLRSRSETVGAEETGGNAAGRPVVSKMPVAQEAALSMAIEIETEIARIALWLGASAKSSPQNNFDWIVGNLDGLADEDLQLIAYHLGRLVRSAEIELEHLAAPRKLRARCPGCQAFGQITVHFRDGDIAQVVCQACEAHWGRHQLGDLNTAIERKEA